MPKALLPGADEISDAYHLRDRSPHPYSNLHRAEGFSSGSKPDTRHGSDSPSSPSQLNPHEITDGKGSRSAVGTGSESGTEADDERSHILKALPPPAFRPSKGLKTKDGTASPLLTPSQLDREGRRLLQGYFNGKKDKDSARSSSVAARDEERRKFESRRTAERIRRLCEGVLVGVIGLLVAYGSRIWALPWPRYMVIITGQVLAIAGLVAFYPLRLVSVQHQSGHLHIWSRFHIPPSFDPATILYPTFLPVLVSLSLLQDMPELLLPNLLLGLASLPPRLFPYWSRHSDINVLHWMISLVPLVLNILLDHITRVHPRISAIFQGQPLVTGVDSGTLVLLYPLHHALLPPLHYLTTTSLLPSEKHLLSTALINLLLFADSPQTNILRSLLWYGGVVAFACLGSVMHWNVALARVPSWRLRSSHGQERVTFVGEMLRDWRSLYSRFIGRTPDDDSSGDEDHVVPSPTTKRVPVSTMLTTRSTFSQWTTPTERTSIDGTGSTRRRNTMSSVGNSQSGHLSAGAISPLEQKRSVRKDWVLTLTVKQASLRRTVYAIYCYLCVLAIIFGPVRASIARDALGGVEPAWWILHYLLGDLPSWSDFEIARVWELLQSQPLRMHETIPHYATMLGEAHVRLLMICYWLLVLGVGLVAVLLLSAHIEVDTRRKIFHGIMVTMLLPSTFVDPCFCALALSIVLAVFLLLEVIRAGQVAPLGSAIARFVAPYVDGRDLRGPMVVSHVFLLIGCAIPLWLSLASSKRSTDGRWPGWEIEGGKRQVAMISGVVCVGMGDAAASLIGRRYGRRKWPWIGGKSLEGSAAFAVAVTVGLMAAKAWLVFGGWQDEAAVDGHDDDNTARRWAMHLVKTIAAGCGASFMEAVLTGANDNVVVPVALWLLVRGLGV